MTQKKWWHPNRLGEELKKKWLYVYAVALGSAFVAGFMAHIKVVELSGKVIIPENELFCLRVQQDAALPCGRKLSVHSGYISKSLLRKADGDKQWQTNKTLSLFASPDFSSETTADLQADTRLWEVQSLGDWIFVRTLAD